MRLRATHRHARERDYRARGGPWDVPDLDTLLSARASESALTDRAGRLAAGLRARGVRRRDVVAWQLPNWEEVIALYRACWRLGAVAAPIHHQAGAAEVARMVELLEPSMCFAAPRVPLGERDGTIAVRAAS